MYLEINYTKNHITDETFSSLVIGNKDEHTKLINRKFKLLDDDGDLYFEGELKCDSETDGSEELFLPLDTIGASYGCTEIQYTNDNGDYETL